MNITSSTSRSENSTSFNLDISTIEIKNVFRPYIEKEVKPEEPSWEKIVRGVKRTWRNLMIKRILIGWMKWKYRRTQRTIAHDYSLQWQATSLEQQLSHQNKSAPCEWGTRYFMARVFGIKRVHQLLMWKFIEKTSPQKVLEVGSGNGVNLFVLSSLFPNAQFSGCELTKGGVAVAKEIAQSPSLPKYIQEFSPIKPNVLTSHRRIDFIQGSATELPAL